MPEFRVLRRSRAYDGWAKVDELEVDLEGQDAPLSRIVVESGDAAAVLLHDAKGERFLFARQLRVALERHGEPFPLELVAGKVDSGETAVEAARREAREETGIEVSDLQRVGEIFPSPGVSSEMISIFYGRVGDEEGVVQDAGEPLELVWVPCGEAVRWLDEGLIRDAKTCVALWWFRSGVGAGA